LTTLTNHKQPIDHSPSTFVVRCLAHSLITGGVALACGYGRHTNVLREKDFVVVSGDLVIDGLQIIKQEFQSDTCVCLNAKVDLPFCDGSFDLILVIHYVDKGLLSRIARLLSSDGLLIYETYGGQGNNWRFLPTQGELENELFPNFTIIKKVESLVGDKDNLHVNIKIFAKKI
jgi:SAM-dependent methyltransferase